MVTSRTRITDTSWMFKTVPLFLVYSLTTAFCHRRLFRSRQFNATYVKWILPQWLLFLLYQRAHIAATLRTEYVVYYMSQSLAHSETAEENNLFRKNVVRKISFQTVVVARNLGKRQSRHRHSKTVDFRLLTLTLVLINFLPFCGKKTQAIENCSEL